jgi:hypothetical protein
MKQEKKDALRLAYFNLVRADCVTVRSLYGHEIIAKRVSKKDYNLLEPYISADITVHVVSRNGRSRGIYGCCVASEWGYNDKLCYIAIDDDGLYELRRMLKHVLFEPQQDEI